MRAVVHDRYWPPEVLRLEKVAPPVPKDDEVLVRIYATTVTRTDAGLHSADPLLAVLTRWVGSRRVRLGITRYTKEDVLFLEELVEAGEYQAVIDRTYPLEDVVEATRYVETRQTGNVVLTVRVLVDTTITRC